MPTHHRIPTIIGQAISKLYGKTSPTLYRWSQAEGKVIEYAYKGFKHKSSISKGIRHGLAVGATIGTFITEDGSNTYSGQIQSPTDSSYQARSGYSNSRSGKYGSRKRHNKYRRCTCSKFRKASRNWRKGQRFFSNRRRSSY